MTANILNQFELDLASLLYNDLLNGKIDQQTAAEIAKATLVYLPKDTPELKLEKPLTKLSYAFPQYSTFFKQYLEEVRELMLENLREQKLKGKKYE